MGVLGIILNFAVLVVCASNEVASNSFYSTNTPTGDTVICRFVNNDVQAGELTDSGFQPYSNKIKTLNKRLMRCQASSGIKSSKSKKAASLLKDVKKLKRESDIACKVAVESK